MKKTIISILYILLFAFVVNAGFDINKISDSFDVNQSDIISSEFIISNDGAEDIEVVFSDVTLTSNEDNRTISTTFTDGENQVLENNTNKTIEYSFTLPASMYWGHYTGSFSVYNNHTNSTIDYDITLDLAKKIDLYIPDSLDFGGVYYNLTESKTFEIKNMGNVNITGIEIEAEACSDCEFSFENVPDVIEPGKDEDITAKVFVSFNGKVKEYDILKDIIVNTNEEDYTIEDFFDINVRSYLDVKKVKFIVDGNTDTVNDGDTIEYDAQPLDKVEIRITLENLWEDNAGEEVEIEDVEVEIIINGIDKDEDNIKLGSDKIDLNYEGSDQEHTFEFEFEVPLEAQDDETYDVDIEVIGTDDSDDQHDYLIQWTVKLGVKKDPHKLIISDFEISPNELSCDFDTIVDFEIINAGDNDETYVRYVLKNEKLGINKEKSRFRINTDVDDNTYSESIPLKLINPPIGEEIVELWVYRDYDTYQDLSKLSLVIKACGDDEEDQDEEPEDEEPEIDEQEGLQDEEPEDEEPEEVEDIKEQKKGFQIPKVEIAKAPIIMGRKVVNIIDDFRESDAYTTMLLSVNVIVIILIVLMFILYKKK